jgi:ferric iron reductase protein FhuF
MTHPITETLNRGRQRRHGDCNLGLRTDAGGESWTAIATLAAETELLRALLSRIGQEIGSDRCDVQASIFLESYTWRLVLPLAGALIAEQRVALPAAHDVELRPSTVDRVQLRMNPARFAALPSDIASTHRDAILASAPSDLTACFASMLVDHFAIVIGALRTVSVRSERALWRTVCDRTALALLYAGLACGKQHSAERLAHEILGRRAPLDTAPAYVDLRVDSRTFRTHLRGGCCLWWRTAARGYCATCPINRRTGSSRR